MRFRGFAMCGGMGRWVSLLGAAVCLAAVVGSGCRSSRGPVSPLAFMFPTLYSPRILETVQPFPVTTGQIDALLKRLGLDRGLRQAGLPEKELKVISRGLTARGYAELDARRSQGDIRWVSFRAVQPEGESAPVLIITVGYWSRPEALGDLSVASESEKPEEGHRTDPYGVPQTVYTWKGAGDLKPVLRRVLNAFDGTPSHWEFEVTIPENLLPSGGS